MSGIVADESSTLLIKIILLTFSIFNLQFYCFLAFSIIHIKLEAFAVKCVESIDTTLTVPFDFVELSIKKVKEVKIINVSIISVYWLSWLSWIGSGQDISGLRHDSGKLDNISFLGIKKGENASLLIIRDVTSPIKETIKHKRILIHIPTTGLLHILHIPMFDFKPIDKIVKTKLHITPAIKPKPLSSDYQEVVVVDGLCLLV
jgi:hypothetical protein